MKEGTDMKKWKVISSICLATALIAACSNDSEKTSKEPAKTEAFTTDSHKTTQSDQTNQSSSSSTQQSENVSKKTAVSGEKMTKIEKQKLINFIEKYPVEYVKAIDSGDFTPLANEYIMHDTKLYEDLLAAIPKKHKQGIKLQINKVEVTSIKRNSDTDFTVDTKEIIDETQNGKTNTKQFLRKYKVFYNYVEGNDAQSFFQISDIKDIN